jgi:glycosyltransferase involved in cell wall biosynthesis
VASTAPLISVIIHAHNQGHCLGEAIASVWRSSRRDVEIVVVDDGSRDDTAAVARSFGGVRYISQPGIGRSRARNRGLVESGGQAVVFLDADAQLAHGALDVGAAELDAHPMAAFVFGRWRLVGDGAPALRDRARLDRESYRELLIGNYIGPASTVMFRRASLDRAGGFDPTIDGAAEYGLYLRIARTNRIHDHAQLVAYTTQPNGNGGGTAAHILQDTLTVLRRERPNAETDPTLLEAYHEGWRRARDYYGAQLAMELRGHLRARQWGGAIKKTLQLGWLHPRAIGRHATQKLAASVIALTPRARRTFPQN